MRERMKRLLVPMIVSGFGILILVLFLRASTLQAGAVPADASALQLAPQPAAQTALAAGTWTPLLLDTFDGTSTAPRQVTHSGSANYEWGRVVASSYGFTNTMWSVGGAQGISLTAGLDPYTNGVTTTLTYGPFNMNDVVTAELQFSQWISVASGDGLEWGYATGGGPFVFNPVTPASMSTWYTTTLNSGTSEPLSSLLGHGGVYLAFRFHSNDDNQVALGVFLDNVQLRVQYDVTLYVPVAFRTDLRGFSDDFSDVNSGWPTWKKKTSNENHRGGYLVSLGRTGLMNELLQSSYPLATLQKVEQDESRIVYKVISADGAKPAFVEVAAGEPEVFYSVVHDAWDKVFVSGPFRTQTGNFTYEVQARYSYVDGNRKDRGNAYGILISQVKVDPAAAHDVKGYSVYLEINPKLSGGYNDAGWAIKRWSTVSSSSNVRGPHTTKLVNSELGAWNKIKLERIGSLIRVYVNDQLLAEGDDGTYTGPMYVGFYAHHTGSGATELSYDVLFEWDDVLVTPR